MIIHCFAMTSLALCFLFSAAYGYDQNPYVSSEVWQMLSPYFLPESHPLKQQLDVLFSKRITLNAYSLKKAGFENPEPQKYSQTIVTKHKKIAGYYFKLFTDDQPSVVDWKKLYARALGADRVRKCLNRNQLHHLCKVPKKWIYPLPAHPSPPQTAHRKNFILIAEDMQVYSKSKSLKRWKSKKQITPELLDALYLILQEEGLNDSAYAFNMPFSKVDQKVAFIDLEETYVWPVRFNRLTQYLPLEIQPYWMALFNTE